MMLLTSRLEYLLEYLPCAFHPGPGGRPDDQPRQLGPPPGDRRRRLRHPLRAAGQELSVRARVDGVMRQMISIPKHMHAERHQPPEGHGRPRHRRAAAAAGRPRSVRFGGHPIDIRIAVVPTTLRRAGRCSASSSAARAGSRSTSSGMTRTRAGARSRRRSAQPYGGVIVCGPDRLGQDDDALRRARAPSTTAIACSRRSRIRSSSRFPASRRSRSTPRPASRSRWACGRCSRRIPTSSSSARSATRRPHAIAAQASMTGHLVLSSLHVHSAASALTRAQGHGRRAGAARDLAQLHRRPATRSPPLRELPRALRPVGRGSRLARRRGRTVATSACFARSAASTARAPASAAGRRSSRSCPFRAR